MPESEERELGEEAKEKFSSAGYGKVASKENIPRATQRNSDKSSDGAVGFVYFIENHDQTFVKIGFSKDVVRRFGQPGTLMPGLRFLGQIPHVRDYGNSGTGTHEESP